MKQKRKDGITTGRGLKMAAVCSLMLLVLLCGLFVYSLVARQNGLTFSNDGQAVHEHEDENSEVRIAEKEEMKERAK